MLQKYVKYVCMCGWIKVIVNHFDSSSLGLDLCNMFKTVAKQSDQPLTYHISHVES